MKEDEVADPYEALVGTVKSSLVVRVRKRSQEVVVFLDFERRLRASFRFWVSEHLDGERDCPRSSCVESPERGRPAHDVVQGPLRSLRIIDYFRHELKREMSKAVKIDDETSVRGATTHEANLLEDSRST